MNATELKSKLTKSVDFLKSELAQIRTGRASPTLIENIVVEAYDSKMTLKEVGTISSLDAQNLVVAPWDKSLIKSIASAVRNSELQLSPVIDGDVVRVPLPALTEERRMDMVKLVAAKVEEAKTALRNIRQEAMKDIDKDFNEKKLGEDEKFSSKESVEKIVKEFVALCDTVGETKKQELMRV